MPAFLRRYFALTLKELQQLSRNRRLLIQLILPPTVVLTIFGFALNPKVRDMRTGIVDEDHTRRSRELVSTFTENPAFRIAGQYVSTADADAAMRRLELDMFLVIPADFSKNLDAGKQADVQAVVDAVNANRAAISQGYLGQAIAAFNQTLIAGSVRAAGLPVDPRAVVLYNPGLVNPWFFVTGVMSVLIFLNGTLVASALAVREKELGTLEQLLMSPAQTLELLMAKVTPVYFLLILGFFLALTVSVTVFGLPVRGSLVNFWLAGTLAAMSGIGIGVMVATFSSTQQQAQLLSFFLIPPITSISGSFAPLESMPWILKTLSYLDPLRYMVIAVRAILLKGAGLAVVWPELSILACFGVVLFTLSAGRFRRQLG